ncbi:MAG TPA: hypothetical protein VFE33_22515 [Thermoanaerobaculia bacterium]|nr:hypothetical protein [Thermoanaerobaculia bacterium]
MSVAMPAPLLLDASSPTPPRDANPWKGLHFYTEEDQKLFFGRSQETEEFLRLIRRDTLSVLFARSGLGKTSLLRAGVIPRLRQEGFLPITVRLSYAASAPPPGRQILEATLAAAAETGIDVEQADESSLTSYPVDRRETLWEFFHAHRFWGQRNDPVVPVLILDQFEELFTLARQGPYMEELRMELADLAENRMPQTVERRLGETAERLAFDTQAQNYRMVLSLREDFVPKLDSLREILPSVMRNRFALAPLDRKRGIEVVRLAGSDWVSEAVVGAIVDAVAGESGTPGPSTSASAPGAEVEPAYLSVMCHELFQRMEELGRDEIGSDLVATERGNILDAMYERSFKGLDPKTRWFVEDRLLTASGFRGTVPLAEAQREGVPKTDLESLVDRRLLRFEDRLGTTHVELSHDLLTRIAQKSCDQRREAEYQAKLHRTRQRTWAVAGVAALLLCAIGFYYFGWVKPDYSYCRDVTSRWGVMYPVGPLPSSAVAHRSRTQRLKRQGWFGDVQMVEVIDANGQPTPNYGTTTYLSDAKASSSDSREKESRYEFVYDSKKRLVYEIAWNRSNQVVWGLVYSPHAEPAGIRLKAAKATYLGPDGYPQPQGHSIAEFVEFKYDEHGFSVEERYTNRAGLAMPGPDATYGQRSKYDKEGRPVRVTSVNEAGKPMNDKDGRASQEFRYDKDGNVVDERALDARGEPTLAKGYHRLSTRYDKWGRGVEWRYFGLTDEPVIDADETGAHRVTAEYDDSGNAVSTKLYGTANEPIVAGEFFFDFPAHEQRVTFDRNNRAESVAYFGADGKPMAGDGWHSYRLEYDERGFLSVTTKFDDKGKPATSTDLGAHRWERVNDDLGQPIEERFFDIVGKPVAIADGGYHLRNKKYDRDGNVVERTFFGIDGNPGADKGRGDDVHRVAESFDRFRNSLSIEYFDVAGQPANNSDGFSRIASNYGNYGEELGTRWFDKDGNPTNGPQGVHYVKYAYDTRGLRTELVYLDAKDQPAVDRYGVHENLYAYNDKRQQIRSQKFGLDREPVDGKDGDHLVLHEFDERGRETKVTRLRADGSKGGAIYSVDGQVEYVQYGPDGKRVFNPLLGFAIRKTDSRKRGDTIESYHGADGALITGPEGYAEVRRHWGDRGTLLAEAWFGPDGSPVAGPSGYHRMEYTPGTPKGTTRYFDVQKRELTSLGPDAFVSIIFLRQITDIKQSFAGAGVHAGDILWRYGNWWFPKAWEAERSKGGKPDAALLALKNALWAEYERLGKQPVTMTVFRYGKPIEIGVPPLAGTTLGVDLGDRAVPVATFEQWRRIE